MTQYRKKDFPLTRSAAFLEPGPTVLVSSAWQGKTNIMTMSWHMIMAFEPAPDLLLYLGRQPQL